MTQSEKLPKDQATTLSCRTKHKGLVEIQGHGSFKENAVRVDNYTRVNEPNEEKIWIEDPPLMRSEKNILLEGKWLNTSIISAASKLLKKQFPKVTGLLDTLALQTCQSECVQIIHVNRSHWITVSSRGCAPGIFNLYDSMQCYKVTQDTIFKVAGLVKSECEELEIRGIDVLNKKMEVIVVYMLSLMHMSSAEARTRQK